MARINIEGSLFADIRFQALSRNLGSSRLAIGTVTEAFFMAQKYWVDDGSLIPESVWKIADFECLIDVHLAERRDSGIYLCGSEKQFDWLLQKSAAGKKSAESRKTKYGTSKPLLHEQTTNDSRTVFAKPRTTHEPPTPTPTPTLLNSFPTESAVAPSVGPPVQKKVRRPQKDPSLGSMVWVSYAEAFKARYKTEPPRGAKANAICKRLVESLGIERAKAIVALYVKDNESAVVQRAHPFEWIESRKNSYLVKLDTGSKPGITSALHVNLAKKKDVENDDSGH